MNNGYFDKFLMIDLSSGNSWEAAVPDWLKASFVGGKGYGLRLLYDLAPPQGDPLAADNVLMFMTGPLTGTLAPSMRACVVTKSPLTGTLLDSYFGGSFGPEIKYCGYDGIIITGRASEPVYLWIDDGRVEIRPARKLWGISTLEVNKTIKEELKDDSVKIACIGPAGENMVSFALISCEYNRQAGRGGAGAVMGSKNLKAVALRGSKPVRVWDQGKFLEAVELAYRELKDNPDIKSLTLTGTASSVPFANEAGVLPRRNYYDGVFEGADEISDFGQNKHLWLRSDACTGCPIRCSKMGYLRSGRYRGTVSDIVEYETAAMLGSNLEISDVKAVTHLAHLCDTLGLDSMSAGGAIGFAMEAAEKTCCRSNGFVDMRSSSEVWKLRKAYSGQLPCGRTGPASCWRAVCAGLQKNWVCRQNNLPYTSKAWKPRPGDPGGYRHSAVANDCRPWRVSPAGHAPRRGPGRCSLAGPSGGQAGRHRQGGDCYPSSELPCRAGYLCQV